MHVSRHGPHIPEPHPGWVPGSFRTLPKLGFGASRLHARGPPKPTLSCQSPRSIPPSSRCAPKAGPGHPRPFRQPSRDQGPGPWPTVCVAPARQRPVTDEQTGLGKERAVPQETSQSRLSRPEPESQGSAVPTQVSVEGFPPTPASPCTCSLCRCDRRHLQKTSDHAR